MKTILFQGDSITDCGRNRTDLQSLGTGYPNVIAAGLGYARPGEFAFINKGVSGNRIVDVYARIKADIINKKPDYMSLLVGVNDVWHELSYQNGVDAAKFEKIYTMLIEEVRTALPDIRILLLGPYVMKGTATAPTAEDPNRWNSFFSEVPKRAEAVQRIAAKFGLPYIPLQARFDAADKAAGGKVAWTADGVHPTPAGHGLIAAAWMDGFRQLEGSEA